jgi:hypothetical protein
MYTALDKHERICTRCTQVGGQGGEVLPHTRAVLTDPGSQILAGLMLHQVSVTTLARVTSSFKHKWTLHAELHALSCML